MVDQELREKWNFKFKLCYTVLLFNNTLETRLEIFNTDEIPFDFTCLLHTYFNVDVESTVVLGLENTSYTDMLLKSEGTQKSPLVVDKHSDINFYNVCSDFLTISSKSRKYVVHKKNFKDVVVWNPWSDPTKSDLLENEYKSMLCVEVGNLEKILLLPSQSFCCSQTLIAVTESE